MKHINDRNTAQNNCCGCSACQSVCPRHCISMVEDKEGFLYPKVNELQCVDCGLCSDVCSWIDDNKEKGSPPLAVYAAKHKDNEIRDVSTSGGMFTALASYVFDRGGIVYGASFISETQSVGHIGVSAAHDLNSLRGSKYVQSSMGNVFHEIQSKLKEGRYVLYTGTPCQCEGLRRFLRRDYETLFIIDILCHSVPSPRILGDLLQNYGGNFEKISFRNKDLGWRTSYQFRMFRGKEVLFNDSYLTMFFKGLTNRPSCYCCKFTNTNRPGDITIGDYWNINSVVPDFEDSLGVSCLFVNNEKGKAIFEHIKNTLDCFETELSPALQTCMMRNVTEPKDRKNFWRDYKKYGFKYCEAKYGRMTIWECFRDRTIAPFVRKIGIAAFLRKIRYKYPR